jgi:hypothetical protein
MPAVMFRNLLPGLSGSSSKLHGAEDSSDALLATEFAISILERCELSDNSLEEEDEDYILLGQALTRIVRYAAEEKNDGLEQATLRLVVKLSNNKSKLSQALASANMLDAALVVIKTNFSNLASSADLGEDLDEQKLDSVMLALGCLLNFVDGSPGMCRKMIELGDNSTISPVGWLVATFNERVGKASDVRYSPISKYSDQLTFYRQPPSTSLECWWHSAIYQCFSAPSALRRPYAPTL